MTYYVAGEGRRMWGQTTPSELPDKFNMSVRQPHGVVAAITPWNFPIAIPCWKLMPALVTGNTVVFKPSPFSPLSAHNLVGILEEAGLPPGVVNLVFGEKHLCYPCGHRAFPCAHARLENESGCAFLELLSETLDAVLLPLSRFELLHYEASLWHGTHRTMPL